MDHSIIRQIGLPQFETPPVFKRLVGSNRSFVEELLQERAAGKAALCAFEDQVAAYGNKARTLSIDRGKLMTRDISVPPPSANDPQIVEIDREIEICTNQVLLMRPKLDRNSAINDNIGSLISTIEIFLKKHPGELHYAEEFPAPNLSKGETYLQAIEVRRRRARELLADISKYRAAPIHSSVVLKAEIDRINADAQRGAPDAFDAIETGSSVRWPFQCLEDRVMGHAIRFNIPDVEAIMSHLFREQMIAAAKSAIEASADDANALSESDRSRLIAEANRDLLVANREEVALTRAARASGMKIDYRPDVDARALLGLAD